MYKIYQVEYGDTIDIIASKVGTTKEELEKINGFEEKNIMPGELIIVPNINKTNEVFIKYKVKNGDTLYMIAKTYDIDIDTLSKLNGLNKDEYIYPNQEIIIPNKNVDIYITKNGDSIDTILNRFNTTLDRFGLNGNKIYLLEDQLIIHKRDNY